MVDPRTLAQTLWARMNGSPPDMQGSWNTTTTVDNPAPKRRMPIANPTYPQANPDMTPYQRLQASVTNGGY